MTPADAPITITTPHGPPDRARKEQTMKKIKNLTAAEILKQIKLTVICGEEITETNVCDGFSTWMEQFDASNPYEAFTPESREYFQNKLFVAFAAGMLPAEVTETRTNEVGPDGCWVFTVETAGQLDPYEETEETEETTAPAEEQTTKPAQQPLEAPQTAPAAEAALHPTTPAEAAHAAPAAPQADGMTATEREALDRINARQNAANRFTNITPADIAAEIETMNDEQKEEVTPMSTTTNDLKNRVDRIAVALGGPNIYIDTREGYVKGYWGGDREEAWIPSEICEEIDSIMEEYCDMVRRA